MILSKKEIREINKSKRREMTKAEAEEKSSVAAEVFLNSDIYKSAGTIMLYMPLGNETDTTDIMNRAFCDGKGVVLPVTDLNTGDITPCYVTKNTEFAKGAFGVNEPCGEEHAKPLEIDVVLLPGIAFDKNGSRVGFGKGCYDRFLEGFKGVKVGYCYQFQVADEIETKSHDIKVDFLITEEGLENIKMREDF